MTVHTIRGAFRDLNCKGRGEETFRKVWRDDVWKWISGTLPSATILAADRRAVSYGEVETGEIVASFGRRVGYGGSRKCNLENLFLVSEKDGKVHLTDLPYTRPAIGRYAVIIDSGAVELPDPLVR